LLRHDEEKNEKEDLDVGIIETFERNVLKVLKND
jgi:hypothetical protein